MVEYRRARSAFTEVTRVLSPLKAVLRADLVKEQRCTLGWAAITSRAARPWINAPKYPSTLTPIFRVCSWRC